MAIITHSHSPGHALRSNLIAGGAVGILTVITSVSFGTVIFAGELSEFLPEGIGLTLLSALTVVTIVAAFSVYPAIVATPQDTTIPVLALVARHIVETMPAATPEERFYTVVATIILNSLSMGILFLGLGRFKLGELIRFMPYPVVAGFLAGMGVLLIEGAFHSLSGIDSHHLKFKDLFYQDVLLQWLPGLIFALVLFFALQKVRRFWVIPVILTGAIGLFYLAILVSGTAVEAAVSRGLLLGHIPDESLFHFTPIAALTHADWPVVFHQLPDLAGLWLIDTIALLFSASAIELAISRDLDLNHELSVAGVASIASGAAGGIGGFPVLGETELAHHLGGTARLVGWTIAAICLVMLLGGASILPFLPKFVTVGVPLLLGLELLYQWLYRSWFKFSLSDFGVILLIVLMTTTVGYLAGVAVGLIAAVAFFVIDFSRISVVKHELSGTTHQSHVLRPPQQRQYLYSKGEQIQMLELQGFIFFATANQLLNRIKQQFTLTNHPVKFLLLDFRQVTGLDSSAVLSFIKLKQLASQRDFYLLLTNLKPKMQQLLQQSGCLNSEATVCQYFPDLDRGLEWCEIQILDATRWRRSRFVPLPLQLERWFSDPEEIVRFTSYLEKLNASEEKVLFHQGEAPKFLYFIESGQVSTFLESVSGQSIRLHTLQPGTILGEIAFHTQTPYTMTAVVDQSSTLYCLSAENLQRMIHEQPKTAAIFESFMLTLLAERLAQSNADLKNLLS